MTTPGPDLEASDQELIERAAHADHAAFETLYLRYRDWVVTIAWRFTHNQDLSLDVLQEVFAYLVRRLPTLRLEGRLTTFLYPAVKHAALNLLRARRHAPNPGPDRDPGKDAAPEVTDASPGATPEHLAALRSAVEALPDTHREVLLMRFVSGMSLAEIAIALEISLGTVKSRLHGALETLASKVPGGNR